MAKKTQPMKVRAGQVPRGNEEAQLIPLVDVYELEDGTTILEAEISGAEEDSIDIRVEKGVLTIAAETDLGEFGEEFTRTYTGFFGGRYFRAFALSDETDREKIEASLSNGVLTLKLPRAEAAQTRKIEIKEA